MTLDFSGEMAVFYPHLGAVALCAARLLPVAFLCPLFGGSAAPTTVKLSLVLALSLWLHFAAGVAPAEPVVQAIALLPLALRELAFGAAVGLLASLPFDSARMGGRFIDLFRGSSAEAALPVAGSKEAATGDFLYQLLVALACVGVGFPLIAQALFRTFALVKLGTHVPTDSAAIYVAQLLGTAFGAGLALGAPVAGLSLIVDAALGLASRAAGQLNLQEISAPLRILGGGAVLWLAVGVLAQRLLESVAQAPAALETFIEMGR